MKRLPKHLRPRWRYIAVGFETWPSVSMERNSFQRSLWYAGQNLLGDPGSADALLSVVQFNYDTGYGEAIIKVRRDETERARAAITCVSNIDDSPIGIYVRGISGTIRSAEEKYLGRRELAETESTVVFDNVEQVAVMQGDNDVTVKTDDTFVGATQLDIE